LRAQLVPHARPLNCVGMARLIQPLAEVGSCSQVGVSVLEPAPHSRGEGISPKERPLMPPGVDGWSRSRRPAELPGRLRPGTNLDSPACRRTVWSLRSGDLRPGKTPNQVMEAALSSLGHHVDATDITVIDGTARILLRFTVPACSAAKEDTAAQAAARHTREAVEHIASTGRHRLVRRRRGSWLPLG